MQSPNEIAAVFQQNETIDVPMARTREEAVRAFELTRLRRMYAKRARKEGRDKFALALLAGHHDAEIAKVYDANLPTR